jgi:hypothetical protein
LNESPHEQKAQLLVMPDNANEVYSVCMGFTYDGGVLTPTVRWGGHMWADPKDPRHDDRYATAASDLDDARKRGTARACRSGRCTTSRQTTAPVLGLRAMRDDGSMPVSPGGGGFPRLDPDGY